MKSFRFQSLVLVIALLLIISFALHDMIHHDHPKELFGNDVQAVLHMEDRKWWVLFVVLVIHLGVFVRANFLDTLRIAQHVVYYSSVGALAITFHLREALRRGILHPKLYARC